MSDLMHLLAWTPVLTGTTMLTWMILKGILKAAPKDMTLLSTTYENPAVKAICWIWIGGFLVSLTLLIETTRVFGWYGKPSGQGVMFGQNLTGEFTHRLNWGLIYANWILLFFGTAIIYKINKLLDTPILQKRRRIKTFK